MLQKARVGEVVIENYAKIYIDTNKLAEYMHKLLPSYMKNHKVRVVLIGSFFDSLLINVKGMFGFSYKKRVGLFDKGRTDSLPMLFTDGVMGEICETIDDDGYHVINLYVNELMLMDSRWQFETMVCVTLLHEFRHLIQKLHWNNYEELNKSYIKIENVDDYYSHPLEVDAREWSMDRFNYVMGTNYIYNDKN
ncbi:MAG: hypothetical protein ACRCX8_14265 [Sarcina sp.]